MRRQRKRGGFIRARGEGRWLLVLTWTDDAGTSRQKGEAFKGSRQEAEAALAALLRRREMQQDLEPGRITLAEFLQVWLRDHADANLAPKTASTYRSFVEKHVSPALGHHKLKRLRPGHVMAYLAGKSSELGPRSILHHYRMLHNALAHAVQWQYLADNPAARVKAPRVDHEERPLIEVEDIARLVAGSADRPWLQIAILLAAGTGLRRGEICGLAWSDVDYERQVIHVRQAVVEVGGEQIVGRPKTKRSRRSISTPASLLERLREEQARQVRLAQEMGADYRLCGRVAAGSDGAPIRPTLLSLAFRAVADTIGLTATFHDLRHAHASHLLAAGIDLVSVSERLGHGSPVVTGTVYAHVVGRSRQAAADESERIMDRVSPRSNIRD